MSFDTREYEWADITVIAGGNDLITIRAVKIKKKQELEEIYGKGAEPIAIQRGNRSYEGEIEVLMSDYIALEKASGDNILNANFDLLIHYGNPASDSRIYSKKIVGIKVAEAEEAAKQGDKFVAITLPFKALGMQTVSN